MKLLLVDYGSLFRMAWHASEGQEVSAAYEKTVAKVRWLSAQHDRTVIACDAPPYARKELAPDYKSGREPPTPAMIEQGRRTVERLAADGHLVWRVKGQEADDVIGSTVAWALLNAVGEVTIASSDHDLLQLVDDDAKVSQYSFAADKTYRAADVVEKFGVHPRDFADFKALVGDKSDAIAGCPGCGPKTAAKWLMEHGHLAAIASFASAGKLEPKKVGENMAASIEQVMLARRLVTLRTDLQLPFGDIYKPAVVAPLVETEELDREEDVTDQEVDEVISRPTADKPFEPQPAPKSEPPPPAELVLHKNGNGHAALAAAPSDWRLNLEPNDLRSAYVLAKSMVNSRLYTKFANPDAIMAIMLRGREMGLGALESLDSFHLVEGRPTPSAHLLISKAKQHPECEYFQFVAGDDTFAEYVCKRAGNPEPTRLRYTIEQAEKAGLLRRGGNWNQRPAEMLRKTCGTQLARIEFPDALGSAYATEELEQ